MADSEGPGRKRSSWEISRRLLRERDDTPPARISGLQRSSGTNTGGREGVNCTGGWPGEKSLAAFDRSHEKIRNRTFSEPLS